MSTSVSGFDNGQSSTPIVQVLQSPTSQSRATPKINEKKPGVRPSSISELSVPSSKAMKISPSPRATRSSQNPEFAAKQRKFLDRVHDPTRITDSETSQDSFTTESFHKNESKSKSLNSEKKRKRGQDITPRKLAEEDTDDEDKEGSSMKKKTKEPTKVVGGVDSYCFECHKDGSVIRCRSCPRVYHLVKCLPPLTPSSGGYIICPMCRAITEAEDTETRSRAMRMLTLDQLCNLMQLAVKRMINQDKNKEFINPVDINLFPNYLDYIVKPMDLNLIKNNIKSKLYGSTEALLADAKWIYHNSCIFNGAPGQSSITTSASGLLKICLQEMQDIENCPECYLNSHTRSSESWFIEACRRPHVLIWAKLKSYPFWPAKAMGYRETNGVGLVDVRFFGAHDRAWVPLASCYLYSKLPPAPSTSKNKRSLEDCIQELEAHIKKLRDKFGQFEFPAYKTPYDPNNDEAQLAMLLPMYEAKIPGKRSSRLYLLHDGARKSLAHSKFTASVMDKSTSASSPLMNGTPNSEVSIESADNNTRESATDITTDSTTKESITGDPKDSNIETPTSPMVSFPKAVQEEEPPEVSKTPVKRTKQKMLKRTSLYSSSSAKLESSPGLKPSSKVPLTAAAKKCFATDQTCDRCKASNTNSTPGKICSACSLSTSNVVGDDPAVQGKSCAHCHTSVAMSWSKGPSGLLLCSSCDAERLIKEKSGLTFEKFNVTENDSFLTEKNISMNEIGDLTNTTEPDSEQLHDKGSTQLDGPVSSLKDNETNSSITVNDHFGEFSAVDSPPKFIIPKASGDDLPNISKKVSIVETLLQEKNLCFAVEEAIKMPNSTVIEQEITVDTTLAKTTGTVQEAPESQVLMHSEENNQASTAKIKDTPKITQNHENNGLGIEMETSSESSSEIDSEIDGEMVDLIVDQKNEQGNKKKKEININNVVRSLTERKSSVDESREVKRSNEQKSSALMLDDSNDGCSTLLINESGDSSNESKKVSSKTDTRRRKGIPAKVCNRSSTSTESTASSPESKSKDSSEVLDEVNGQFRRSSEDSDVTIMLVTENATPQKDKSKQVRSVNVSKSLSISVINKPSADLVMECLDNDLDGQNATDSSSKNLMLRPTARKSFPSNPKTIDISDSTKTTQNKPNESHPPPLVNLRDQTKVYEINHLKNGTPSAGPKPSGSKASIGPVSAKLEEISEKMKEKFQSLFEEMLRECSEAGNLEATIVSLRIEKERLVWRQRQEINELKHNADLQVSENRANSDADKQRALLDAKHRHECEKEQAVNEAKRKQWCISCQSEALLYCCWNSSYCSIACQQLDWANHMGSCTNKQHEENILGARGNVEANRLGSNPRPSFNGTGGQSLKKLSPARQSVPSSAPQVVKSLGSILKNLDPGYDDRHYKSRKFINHIITQILAQNGEWRLRPQDIPMPRLTPRPGYLPPNPQIMRRNEHLMPPPSAPPPYHQVFRPNQVYTVPHPPQFIHHNRPPAIAHRPFAPFPMGQRY